MVRRGHYYMIICGLMIITIAYYCVLKPKWLVLSGLHENQLSMQKQLDNIRNQVEKSASVPVRSVTVSRDYLDKNGRLLSGLSRLAEMNGMMVMSVVHLNSDNRVQIKLTGNYSQLSGFINALRAQKMTIYIEDFSIKSQHDDLLIATLDIIAVLPVVHPLQITTGKILNNRMMPFCHSGAGQLPIRAISYSGIDKYSVKQIRLHGIMNIENRHYALLALPDGAEEVVTAGDSVGIEKLLVLSINSSELNGVFPDKNKFKIRFDGAG